MQSGLINKVAITAANTTYSKGYKLMLSSGDTYVDKGCYIEPAKQFATRKGVHICAVKK